jgi:hypothetical protein
VDRYSFLVRLFHPLLQTGLSRRTVYPLYDRDSSYGHVFRQRVRGMAIREVFTAPRSPWQSPHVEHLIGSVRRECLDHLVVLNEESLHHTLKLYFAYYHRRIELLAGTGVVM